MNDFFGKELREMYRRNFEKLKLEQRRKALNMIATYIERAQGVDFPELRKRLSLDGEMSQAEKRHLSIVETLFNRRLETLRTSRAAFMAALGLR